MWRNSLQVTPTDTAPFVPELPDAKNLFGGMPLRGWEHEADRNVSEPMMIMYRGYMGHDCLTFAAMNQLLALAACTGVSQQLFVYDHSKLNIRMAHDTTLCLDVFVSWSGAELGLYWCHGGYNQQFRPGIAPVNSTEPDTWCAFEGRQSFCVRKESMPHDAPWATAAAPTGVSAYASR